MKRVKKVQKKASTTNKAPVDAKQTITVISDADLDLVTGGKGGLDFNIESVDSEDDVLSHRC